MKKSIITVAVFLLSVLTINTSCNSSEEKVNNAQENVDKAHEELDKAKAVYESERLQFALESEERIKENEIKIEELKKYINTKNEEIKKAYENSISTFDQKNKMLKIRMKDYKESGKEHWEIFKSEFNHDMNELLEAIKNLNKDNVK